MKPTRLWSVRTNKVERFFGWITSELLQPFDHRSVQTLEKEIRNYLIASNEVR